MTEDVHSVVAEIPALRRYARSLTRDRSSADDLVQDAVTRSIEKFHTYQPDTRLLPWLFTVMLNIFRDQQRRSKKQAAMIVELSDAGHGHTTPVQIERLVHRDLVRQLDTLKPEYRRLLLLVGSQGISYREAASLTGLPMGTVRSRLFRARSQLLHKLEGRTDRRNGSQTAATATPRGSALL